jgi:branched-chain amino acid transport system ATP-binding protein
MSQAADTILRVSNIETYYGPIQAIRSVSLDVPRGRIVAVLGANGAGKTTLFNAITGDFPPTAGSVRFFGEDVTTLPPHERIRRGLRRTYQISLLFQGLSVLDNLYLATRGVTRQRYSLIRPAPDDPSLEAARDLAHVAHLDAVADKTVSELSYGQQRQLEIGMALAGAPRFVLFDEPAAGLSPADRRELIAILRALPLHIGYIVIEHDLDVALRVVESVTVMHNGRVFKEGTPESIEADADVQAIYLGAKHG